MTRRTTLVALLCCLITSGCSERTPLSRGVSHPEALTVRVRDLQADPRRFTGKLVRIHGRVTRTCQHVGCWFYVADGGHEIYVDLEQGIRFVIPIDSTGREASVEGIVRRDGGDVRLVGRHVVLD